MKSFGPARLAVEILPAFRSGYDPFCLTGAFPIKQKRPFMYQSAVFLLLIHEKSCNHSGTHYQAKLPRMLTVRLNYSLFTQTPFRHLTSDFVLSIAAFRPLVKHFMEILLRRNLLCNILVFKKYSQMSRSVQGLKGAGEWQALERILPDFAGLSLPIWRRFSRTASLSAMS